MINKLTNLLKAYGISGINKSLNLAISQGFVAVLFVLVDFIFSKQLTVAEFGIWKEIFFIFNLGIPLLAFGLPEGYKYFIAKEQQLEYYFRNLVAILLAISLGVFLVLVLVNFLHWIKYLDLKSYYGYSLLFPFPLLAFLLNKALRYSYINLDNAERLTKLSLYGAIASLVVITAGFYFLVEYKELVVLVAVCIYFSIFFFSALFYFRDLPISSFGLSIDKKAVRQMMIYGLPLYLATFAGLLSNYLDKLIVNFSSDDATFAIFAVGAFEIPFFAMLSAAFSQQIFPKMVTLIEDGKDEKAKELWIQTTKKVSLITYPIILIVMFFANDVIFFIYNENYSDSVILFKTYLLVALFRNNSYGILLAVKGKTKSITKISLVILLVNLILSLSLFYFFGLKGVVFGTLIANFLMWLIYLYKENLIKTYYRIILRNKIILLLTILILISYFI